MLFLGAAMSITAFPVLARILTERRMHRTPVGVLALACAAIDDVVAWSLLAVVVAVAAGGTLAGFGTILLLTVVYALVMVVVVRPLLARLTARYHAAGRLTPTCWPWCWSGLLRSACATEVIGIHVIFGAFVFGAVMPRSEPALTRAVLQRLEQVSTLLLLPVFFVIAGLQVDVRGVASRARGAAADPGRGDRRQVPRRRRRPVGDVAALAANLRADRSSCRSRPRAPPLRSTCPRSARPPSWWCGPRRRCRRLGRRSRPCTCCSTGRVRVGRRRGWPGGSPCTSARRSRWA